MVAVAVLLVCLGTCCRRARFLCAADVEAAAAEAALHSLHFLRIRNIRSHVRMIFGRGIMGSSVGWRLCNSAQLLQQMFTL